MNAITDFFVRNIVVVFFFYGLAFFVMGMALLFVGRRTSQLRLRLPWCRGCVWPPACAHEWYEMFQKIGGHQRSHRHAGSRVPGMVEETVRLLLLSASFVALLVFALVLLTGAGTPRRRIYLPVLVSSCSGSWVLPYSPSVISSPRLPRSGWPTACLATASAFPLPCSAPGR